MQIYHGSKDIINRPEFNKGKPSNDYGMGFYCTEDFDLACEWAVDKDRDGYANCYELDISNLKILNLNEEPYGIMEWLAILLQYRDINMQFPVQLEAREYIINNFLIDVSEYDVICGYRADDSFFSFARVFLSNSITYRQLKEAMHLGELGQQIVLKSQKAFDTIEPRGYSVARALDWYVRKQQRDMAARDKYSFICMQPRTKDDIFITNIIDKEMIKGDIRLQ